MPEASPGMMLSKVPLTTVTLRPRAPPMALARSASMPDDGLPVRRDGLVRRIGRVGRDPERALRLDRGGDLRRGGGVLRPRRPRACSSPQRSCRCCRSRPPGRPRSRAPRLPSPHGDCSRAPSRHLFPAVATSRPMTTARVADFDGRSPHRSANFPHRDQPSGRRCARSPRRRPRIRAEVIPRVALAAARRSAPPPRRGSARPSCGRSRRSRRTASRRAAGSAPGRRRPARARPCRSSHGMTLGRLKRSSPWVK